MKKLFDIIPWFVILFNLPCLYYSAIIAVTNGGTWGYGWFVFPILFGSSLFIIPALIRIKRKGKKGVLNVLNAIGLLLVLIILSRSIIGYL
jgi:hypothetical protein